MTGRNPARAAAVIAACAAFLLIRVSAEPPSDFRFCILGDRTGAAQPGVYERAWKYVASERPNFVINAGDTIQGGNDATAEAEWRAVEQLWSQYRLTFYLVPGNHDIWSPASREIYEKQTGHPAFYGFDYQNSHFTVLDNSQTEDLSDEQMAFLRRDLSAHQQRNPKFVLFHKPFWLVPVKFRSSQFPFHQLVKQYGVRYVISGHTHRYEASVNDGIVYMEVPSSGGKLKNEGYQDGWFFGYVLAHVTGSRVEMTVKELGEPFGRARSQPVPGT